MAYTTVDELKNEIVSELTTELTLLSDLDIPEDIIPIKVSDAIREAQKELRIPSTYSDNQILTALTNVYANIKAKAFCKINRIGFEFEDSNTENGVSRKFTDYEKLSNGIIPIAKVF